MDSSITASRSQSLSPSLSGSQSFLLRRRLWLWPIIAGIVLGVIGWFMHSYVEGALKKSMAANLKTILDADVAALKIWLEDEEMYAGTVAVAPQVRAHVEELLELAKKPKSPETMLLRARSLRELRKEMQPWLVARHYNGFVVIDPGGQVIAAQRDILIGRSNLPLPEEALEKLFPKNGSELKPLIILPFRSVALLEDKDQILRAGLPTMFVAAPILKDGSPVAAIGLRIRPEMVFTRILSVARAGESGETYAFDKNGLLISQSRFEDELKSIGLLSDREGEQSILNIEIRDPQVNMVAGKRPPLKRSERELTRMAADATQGNSGVDVEGYRDYRGVPVIGAWNWLPEYGFGVTTEVDMEEAFYPLYILRYTFWGLFALLSASAVVIFIFTVIVARLERQARQAALQAKRLGQYTLEEKVGTGGIGVVYRGHHSMLRRPTAIKLLDIERTTNETIARFEREVQLTSRLNHPNTVAVYDYGRTPEGVFYYAMEFLEGINLDTLVKRYGPQPEGRAIKILEQICGSLIEAHGIGLIHRDIKPANIILSQRGGMSDVVKLLDFGLVKALDAGKQSALTAADTLTGTPLYVSPEGIAHPERVDVRSDLYAVGAVGYYLLTGKPVFDGKSVVEICMHQVHTPPVSLSERLGKPVSEDLERVIMKCLKKDPEQRPQNAKELLLALRQCKAAGSWSDEDAAQWWKEHQSEIDPMTSPDATADSQGTHARETTLIVSKPVGEQWPPENAHRLQEKKSG
ncbi:Serine/threonine protein kinase-related protein [Nitrosococcus halophilus Nc 4]|uniref:Serine/threonine protein kinase-related protein n=1 Tax=Nitrosococcus halophilus (strain Nc4) TaxID=472759 RepID=D5C082_NITHN|nr:serine/threonine protein kinase [Nitrosococcus halophilus]ADE14408.1 Serine/threonine protein kinase-related protein [Nitrosococcus halophilus Nc 4]